MGFLNRCETALVACNRWALILLLSAMSCVVFANVVLRYTTGDSLVWAEEVARHMMVWITFLGAGLVLRFGGHVAIENLHTALPSRSAMLVRALVALALGVFFLAMAYYAVRYVEATRFQTTAATDISIAWIYAVMPAGFVLLFVHLLFIVRGYVRAGSYAESSEMDGESAAAL